MANPTRRQTYRRIAELSKNRSVFATGDFVRETDFKVNMIVDESWVWGWLNNRLLGKDISYHLSEFMFFGNRSGRGYLHGYFHDYAHHVEYLNARRRMESIRPNLMKLKARADRKTKRKEGVAKIQVQRQQWRQNERSRSKKLPGR